MTTGNAAAVSETVGGAFGAAPVAANAATLMFRPKWMAIGIVVSAAYSTSWRIMGATRVAATVPTSTTIDRRIGAAAGAAAEA